MAIKEANTKNLVQDAMNLKPAIIEPAQGKLKDLIQMPQIKDMFRNALAENTETFLASVIDLYNNDRTLQACSPNEVLMEAFKAAVLKLPLNKSLGFSYIVPFKDKSGRSIPSFQLGYKGMIQLCLRSGYYRTIHAGPVYEGEFVSENRLTGELDLTGLRSGDKAIGFSAYLETVTGFRKSMYMSVEQINAHAKKFSKSYSYGSSPWVTDYEAMCVKTLLRLLLSRYGLMSIEMQTALTDDLRDSCLISVNDKSVPAEPDCPPTVTEII